MDHLLHFNLKNHTEPHQNQSVVQNPHIILSTSISIFSLPQILLFSNKAPFFRHWDRTTSCLIWVRNTAVHWCPCLKHLTLYLQWSGSWIRTDLILNYCFFKNSLCFKRKLRPLCLDRQRSHEVSGSAAVNDSGMIQIQTFSQSNVVSLHRCPSNITSSFF